MYRKQRLEFEEKQAPEIVHCLEAKPFEVIMSLLNSVSLLLLLECHGQSLITSGSHYIRYYTNAQKGIKKQEKNSLFSPPFFFFFCFLE